MEFNQKEFSEKQKTLHPRVKELKNKPTQSELIFKERLESLGIKFIFQKGFIVGGNYCIVDFYLPKPYKIVFEIDGEYHNSEKQKIRDSYRTEYLNSRGFKVIRVLNKDVESFNILNSLI